MFDRLGCPAYDAHWHTNSALNEQVVPMQIKDIKLIYKLVTVGERLFARLPPFWAVLFLSGAIMIGFFALCGWLIGQFISSEVATSPIAKIWPRAIAS